jgi:hypothetical protein
MSDDILKGNFKLDKEIKEAPKDKKSLELEFKERILHSLSGSMVYVERNKLEWDGDE